MPYFPKLKEAYTTQEVVDEFRGYNHNLKIGDGEFFDMRNLTSSYYPLLANRGKRGNVVQAAQPSALLGKSKLAYIDGSRLFYGDDELTSYLADAGFAIDAQLLPKQMVSMGAYIVIFPDKLYINTESYEDCGSLEAKVTVDAGAIQSGIALLDGVIYSICKADGELFGVVTTAETAPENPKNGALWVDTSGSAHSLKQYNELSAMWVDIPTVYTEIYAYGSGLGKPFKKYDGVTISGCAATGSDALVKQVDQLNGSKVIHACGDDYIVVVGLLDTSAYQYEGTITISREIPEMDFVVEAENRLWGCKYGMVNDVMLNEIYSSALGDFKNWNQFLGIATDSYVASVGTDGPWTGAVTHLGYPIFFKENCLHKVYISATGAHQIVDTACRGVQKGSEHSLEVVNETLLFKSGTDICAYDGSLPVSVSPQFGTQRYFDAAAGSLGDKYYVSMADKDGKRHLFVLDTLKGCWHREDDTNALQFARCNGELYYIDADTNRIMCVNGTEGEAEDTVEWMAMTGLMGYTTVEHKYVSRFNLRMKLPEGSELDAYIQYDSDGNWEHVGHIKGSGTGSFLIPVRPRRCDHFQIKLEGKGDIRIYSFAKVLEKGSDVG
jgi:hypothetical protein